MGWCPAICKLRRGNGTPTAVQEEHSTTQLNSWGVGGRCRETWNFTACNACACPPQRLEGIVGRQMEAGSGQICNSGIPPGNIHLPSKPIPQLGQVVEYISQQLWCRSQLQEQNHTGYVICNSAWVWALGRAMLTISAMCRLVPLKEC